MVEMLAVAAIAIVIAGFSVAGVNRFGRYQASAEMGGFNSFLRYSFMQAVRNKEYVRLVIDMENENFILDLTEEERIDIITKRVLDKYLPAFMELAK